MRTTIKILRRNDDTLGTMLALLPERWMCDWPTVSEVSDGEKGETQ